jgi:hypothetical protein
MGNETVALPNYCPVKTLKTRQKELLFDGEIS